MNPCCCCSLRAGGMAIAILELIDAIIGVILSGMGVAGVHVLDHIFVSNVTSKNGSFEFHSSDSQSKSNHGAITGLYVIFWLALILYVIQIVFASVLVHGIKTSSVKHMKAWMIFRVIGILFIILFDSILLSSLIPSINQSMSTNLSLRSGFISDVISILLYVYFIWVIYALMQETMQTHVVTRIQLNDRV